MTAGSGAADSVGLLKVSEVLTAVVERYGSTGTRRAALGGTEVQARQGSTAGEQHGNMGKLRGDPGTEGGSAEGARSSMVGDTAATTTRASSYAAQAATLQDQAQPGPVFVVGCASSREALPPALGRVFTHVLTVGAPSRDEYLPMLRGAMCVGSSRAVDGGAAEGAARNDAGRGHAQHGAGSTAGGATDGASGKRGAYSSRRGISSTHDDATSGSTFDGGLELQSGLTEGCLSDAARLTEGCLLDAARAMAGLLPRDVRGVAADAAAAAAAEAVQLGSAMGDARRAFSGQGWSSVNGASAGSPVSVRTQSVEAGGAVRSSVSGNDPGSAAPAALGPGEPGVDPHKQQPPLPSVEHLQAALARVKSRTATEVRMPAPIHMPSLSLLYQVECPP